MRGFTKKNIFHIVIKYLFFFQYLGYYAILLLVYNAGFSSFSRVVTVPVRIIIIIMLIGLLLLSRKLLKKARWLVYFFLFSFFYFLRLLIDYINNESYYTSIENVFFSFIGFAFIPFIIISILPFNKEVNNKMFRGFFWGGVLFSFLSVLFYSKYVGNVYRLGGTAVEEATLSPLALSYSSSLIIGCFIIYYRFNNVSFLIKFLLSFSVILSIIPFFLGASRGSIFSLFISFGLFFFKNRSISYFIKSLLGVMALLIVLLVLDNYLNSGLFDRFFNIGYDIGSNSSSAIRLVIWDTSFSQFIDNPLIGDKLRVNNWDGYAHNVIIESLQVIGILGTIPFLILLWKSLKSAIFLIYNKPKYSWIAVLFIQVFCMNMFSGSIHSAIWLWFSMALVLNFEKI